MKANSLPLTRWANIHLRALRNNVRFLKNKAPTAQLMAVVKANAYGHSIGIVAPALIEVGIKNFGVATLEEAFYLKRICASEPKMILILGALPPSHYKLAIESGFDFMLHTPADISLLAELANTIKKPARIHLKIDTGMGRIGFLPEKLSEVLKQCLDNANVIQVVGVCSHFSSADGVDAEARSHTQQQIRRFAQCRQICENHILFVQKKPLFHLANSDGTLHYPESHHDMVRTGIALYGYTGVPKFQHMLQPVLSLHSQIVQIRKVPANTPISYGQTFTTQNPSHLAIISIGYEDGVSRRLTNQWNVLIQNTKTPAVGRVTMDQCMVDITNLDPQPKVSDRVTLFGYTAYCKAQPLITAQDWADQLDTIPYEILTGIGQRLPRIAVT